MVTTWSKKRFKNNGSIKGSFDPSPPFVCCPCCPSSGNFLLTSSPHAPLSIELSNYCPVPPLLPSLFYPLFCLLSVLLSVCSALVVLLSLLVATSHYDSPFAIPPLRHFSASFFSRPSLLSYALSLMTSFAFPRSLPCCCHLPSGHPSGQDKAR